MPQFFDGFDLTTFWDDSQFALESYVSEPASDALIASVEQALGYKLPAAYVWLMKQHNGGIPFNLNFPTKTPTTWSEDHIAITGIYGIGRDKDYALCGDAGSQFWIDEWEYPDVGVYFADCPSGGHDMLMFDYRQCGKQGEPAVVHVDQEHDYKITLLAKDFESFIRGLVHDDVYDTSDADREYDLQMVASAAFSPLLQGLCSANLTPFDIEKVIRRLARAIVDDKGFFALHADEQSYTMYDIQFMLYTAQHSVANKDAYLAVYPDIMAMAGEFSTGGYAPDFVQDWMAERLKQQAIVPSAQGLVFSEAYTNALHQHLNTF
jgi:hypothetical protein